MEVVTNAHANGDNGKIVIRSFLFWGFEVFNKRSSVEQKYEVKKVRKTGGLIS